jgi:hypothetical protein
MKEIFETIVNNNHWRSAGTVCGNGSTMAYTDYLRQHLGAFLEKHNINSMFDAPCGDYTWMSETHLPSGLKYIGGDIVESLIDKNKTLYPDVEFCVVDIAQDLLPDVDLLFCRDCLIHLSHADIKRVFENIVLSNIKYVMMTSYANSDNMDIKTGDFRGVNFLTAPYDFALPIDSIEDWIPGYPPRSMCLWSRSTFVEFLNR